MEVFVNGAKRNTVWLWKKNGDRLWAKHMKHTRIYIYILAREHNNGCTRERHIDVWETSGGDDMASTLMGGDMKQ